MTAAKAADARARERHALARMDTLRGKHPYVASKRRFLKQSIQAARKHRLDILTAYLAHRAARATTH